MHWYIYDLKAQQLFVDISKAFDSIHRKKMNQNAELKFSPEKLLQP